MSFPGLFIQPDLIYCTSQETKYQGIETFLFRGGNSCVRKKKPFTNENVLILSFFSFCKYPLVFVNRNMN